MTASKSTIPFRKTAACPASATLRTYQTGTLSSEATELVHKHLGQCDFCNAELPLLAHEQPALSTANKTPELPINLRILAESILAKN